MFFSLLLSSLLLTTDSATVCNKDEAHLVANYSVTATSVNDKTTTTQLILWRNGQTVAHQYPQTRITEAWTYVKHQWLKPMRYFDAHQRAIEYQPGERIHGSVDTDWSYRNQLISTKLLSNMTPKRTSGSGCDTTHIYQQSSNHQTMTLTWLPALKLVKRIRIERDTTSFSWRLNSVNYQRDNIDDFFTQRAMYKTTDFADIGDDHTDPFLTNMVNQGFIEAGASGFYNAQGDALQGGHNH